MSYIEQADLEVNIAKDCTTHGHTPQQKVECCTLRISSACNRLVTSRLVVMSTVWADKKNKSNNQMRTPVQEAQDSAVLTI